MIKTKFWLSLLAISVVLVAGSLAVSPIAVADEDDEDDDDDEENIFGIIIQKLDEILAAIEAGLSSETETQIDNIESEVTNIEGKLDGTVQSLVTDIKTETNKIQMIKDNQYVPFIKTSTTLGNCASAGASQVNKFVNIDASGEDGDFIITGLLITVGGVNAGATMSIGQITIDQLQYTFQSADLISGFSGTPSAEVLGSLTTQGRTMPHQFAADSSGSQDIRFNLFCTATANADLVVKQLTVSGWKKPGHTITIF